MPNKSQNVCNVFARRSTKNVYLKEKKILNLHHQPPVLDYPVICHYSKNLFKTVLPLSEIPNRTGIAETFSPKVYVGLKCVPDY
jgi:hypothetical protein